MEINDITKFLLLAHTKSFLFKVESAKKEIQRALDLGVNFAISCSYGKDSIVLLALIFNFKKLPVIYKDNGYALPCIYETQKKLEKKLGYKTNVLKQEFNFVEFLKENGLPDIDRDMNKQNKIISKIKKDPLETFAKENKVDGFFWGLRAKESKKRQDFIKFKGSLYYNDNRKLWFSSPLYNWSDDDIWAYIIRYSLPYPDLYDKENFGFTRQKLRNSSWITTDGANKGKVVWLRYNYPEFYQKLAKEFPIISTYA